MTEIAQETLVIQMRAIVRVFAGPPAVTALGPIDLDIRRGEYVAIVGPSGSGKSTLLNLLGLLDRPTSGTYELSGVPTDEMAEVERTAVRGRRIGFVFQDFQLLAHRTATENVALGQLYAGPSRKQREANARELLSQVGLGHRLNALPSTLSGGERQRVAIARALANQPEIVLCDEPTGNLDSRNADQILTLIDQLHSQGVTILAITHDPATASRAQRSVTIRDGLTSELTSVSHALDT